MFDFFFFDSFRGRNNLLYRFKLRSTACVCRVWELKAHRHRDSRRFIVAHRSHHRGGRVCERRPGVIPSSCLHGGLHHWSVSVNLGRTEVYTFYGKTRRSRLLFDRNEPTHELNMYMHADSEFLWTSCHVQQSPGS